MTAMLPERFDSQTIDPQRKLACVEGLLKASLRLHSTIDVDEILSRTLEIAARELKAEGAFFVSPDPRLESRAGIYGVIPDDWTRWTERTPLPGYAGAPLPGNRGETIAHLLIYRPGKLSLEEAGFLEGLAQQSALALGNAQHFEKTIEWQLVQRDLDSARAIQRTLLPQTVPQITGYSLRFRSTTCFEVGGDYADILPLDDGRTMMILADVAGKGLASVLLCSNFRSSFRAIAGAGLPLHEMAARLNTLHWQEGMEARRRYITAILLCFDPRTHTAEAVNAGHHPAFLVEKNGAPPERIHASGPPIGMLPAKTYQTQRFSLREGSQLLLYTDGLTQVFQGDEEFGEDRLLEIMHEPRYEDFLDHVWKTLARFSGNARQTDDMTALYLCRAGE